MILGAGKKHRDQFSSDLGLHSDTIELLCGLPPKSLGAVGDPSVTEPTLK
jgi:hypothetical protein